MSEADAATGYQLPGATTLSHAAKLSLVQDKPIMLDYWAGSLDKKVLIGVRENQEKLLVKSEDEYTSPIRQDFQGGRHLHYYDRELDIPGLVRHPEQTHILRARRPCGAPRTWLIRRV